jgi:hypothetical protein
LSLLCLQWIRTLRIDWPQSFRFESRGTMDLGREQPTMGSAKQSGKDHPWKAIRSSGGL